MFFKRKEKIKAIKLYSVGSDLEGINRQLLIKNIVEIFDSLFLELPKDYVIHGPYGIRKGGSVEIKAFNRKLESKGHDKYYALSGETENRLGFNVSFDCQLQGTEYAEFIIWYKSSEFSVFFHDIVRKLNSSLSISCGFEIELNDNVSPFSETEIKKGLFGGTSVSISFEHLTWLKDYEHGGYRAIDKNALLNSKQLKNAISDLPNLKYDQFEHLYFIH